MEPTVVTCPPSSSNISLTIIDLVGQSTKMSVTDDKTVTWLKEELGRQVPEHSDADSFVFMMTREGPDLIEELGSKHALWEYGLRDDAQLYLALSEAGHAAAVGRVKEKRKAGVDAKGMRDANFTPKQMRDGGFTGAETASAFGPEELKEGGYTLQDIKKAIRSNTDPGTMRAFSAIRLLHAGFTFKEMRLAGFKATDLIGAELYTAVPEPGADGVTVRFYVLHPPDMKAAGNKRLLEGEVVETKKMHRLTHTEWMHAQIDDDNLADRPVYLESATIKGFTPIRLAANPKELQDGGYSIKELRAAGYMAAEMRQAGVSAKDALAAGYRVTQLREAGYAAADLSFDGTGRI